MDQYLLIVICFTFSILTKAQTESDTSVVNKPWFWPILAISLALLLSIISTLLILLYIYYNKHKLNDDSDASSSRSTSTISERQQRYSRHVEGFRSPPPPYTTCERPTNLFMTSSLPPSYESHINENPPTIVNVPPTENPTNPTTTTTTTAFDLSSTLTSPSIQTFQA